MSLMVIIVNTLFCVSNFGGCRSQNSSFLIWLYGATKRQRLSYHAAVLIGGIEMNQKLLALFLIIGIAASALAAAGLPTTATVAAATATQSFWGQGLTW